MTKEQFKQLQKLTGDYERISNDRELVSDPACRVVIELSNYTTMDATKEEREMILKGRIAGYESDLTKVESQMAEIFAAPLV